MALSDEQAQEIALSLVDRLDLDIDEEVAAADDTTRGDNDENAAKVKRWIVHHAIARSWG